MDGTTQLPQLPAPAVKPVGDHGGPTDINDEKSCIATSQDTTSDPGLAEIESMSDKDPEEPQLLGGVKFAILYGCILFGCFMAGYDTSCLETLAPVITDDFNALNDLGWYAIAFTLAGSATTLIYGQLYTHHSMKRLFIMALFIFLIGTVVAASAPSSAAFIVGRTICGLGSAGLFAGANIILTRTTSLKYRPTYMAILGTFECLALAFGPLISGAIAHATNWRISFYVQIPLFAVMAAMFFFFVDDIRQSQKEVLTTMEKIQRIDLLGFAINLPMNVTLVFALQWGGTTYSWSSWRIILLLTLAGVLFMIFLLAEYRAGDKSMVPLKMLRQRSVACASLMTFCNSAGLGVVAYYIAIYFQAIRGATTLGSGLMYLPMAIALGFGALISGPLQTHTGYSNPNMIIGCAISMVGAGLITTIQPDTPHSHWIAYLVLYGFGSGVSFQPPYIVVQAILPKKLVPTALVTLSFTQQFGTIIVLSIAQSVFFNRLTGNLASVLPSLDTRTILSNNGAISIISAIPDDYRAEAIAAYMNALTNVFYITLGLTAILQLSSLGIEWRSLKQEEGKHETDHSGAAVAEQKV